MSRILFFGDAADTGFGTVTLGLGKALLDAGHDVRFLSQNMGSEPLKEPFATRTWNLGHPTFDIMGALAGTFKDGWRADANIIVGDYMATAAVVLGLHPEVTKAFAGRPTFHYVPVEGVGLPPAWKHLWTVVQPVAMTHFGADEVAKVTGSRPAVAYHGVDTEAFYPVAFNRPGYREGQPIRTKEEAKASFNYPTDRILVLRTDRHMPRKEHNRLLRAMVPVFETVPNLDLALHCKWIDEGGRLYDSRSKLPGYFHERVLKTDRGHDTFSGLSRADLNVLYNAADIYVTTSAEGFGLTPAEAMACGVPVVGMDYSTLPELVGAERPEYRVGPNGENLDAAPYRTGKAGVLARWHHLTDNVYDHHWASVDVEAFAQAVIRLAQKPQERRALGSRGPAHIAASFTWSACADVFGSLIAEAIEGRAAA